MMTNNNISVSEAISKIESGKSLEGYSINFERIKIEALDVIKLSKAGINVPEESIYYDDDDIAFDEEFEGNWERIDYDPIEEAKSQTEVKIKVKQDIRQWIESENIKLDKLIENLLEGFYQAQKRISEK
mgnify:CR=1 FL=1|jgi:predicted XRE-type DNA-binding protein